MSEILVGCQLSGKAPDMLGPGGGYPGRLDGADVCTPGCCSYRMTVVGDDPVAMLTGCFEMGRGCQWLLVYAPSKARYVCLDREKHTNGSCEQVLETAVDRNAFKDVPCYLCLVTLVARPKAGETRGGQAKHWLRLERQGCYVTVLQM